MNNLESCPWHKDAKIDSISEPENEYFSVFCSECRSGVVVRTNRGDAINAWNTRIPNSAVMRLVEAAKKYAYGEYIDITLKDELELRAALDALSQDEEMKAVSIRRVGG